jgi:CRP-like cAMP-binding protein
MGPVDIMISVYSFYTQQPSSEYIELLEDTEMFTMSFDQLQLVYADHPEFNYFGRVVTEKYYIRSEERHILLRTKSPVERYERLLKSHPDILNKAPLGTIASFLGIDKATLSRIRNPKRKI